MKDREDYQREAAEAILAMVNCDAFGGDAFVEGILKGHRTLQQCFARILAELMHQWSERWLAGQYDERNANTCEWANKIMNLTDRKKPHFKFI